MTIPILAIPQVWHVGTYPEPPPAGPRQLSQEGLGLSVSIHPQAWAQIAGLGDRFVRLTRRDGQPGQFLDAHRARAQVEAWALESGLALSGVVWRVSGFDYLTETAARREHPHGRRVLVSVPLPAPAFARQLAERYAPVTADQPHMVFDGEMFNRFAAGQPALDGVWWANRLAPAHYSAPVGLILPERLGRWQVVEIGVLP